MISEAYWQFAAQMLRQRLAAHAGQPNSMTQFVTSDLKSTIAKKLLLCIISMSERRTLSYRLLKGSLSDEHLQPR